MAQKAYCSSYPFSPDDTYPQLMSDGRALTSYVPSKLYNCKIMQNVSKINGKPFDPRNYRHVITHQGQNISKVHNDCLGEKYTKMQAEMKKDLKELDKYMWN